MATIKAGLQIDTKQAVKSTKAVEKELDKMGKEGKGAASDIDKGLDKVNKNLKKTQKAAKDSSSAFSSMGKMIAGVGVALGAAGLGAAIVSFSKSIIDYGDSVQKLRDQLNLTAEQLTALDYWANRSGLSFQELGNALKTMDRRIEFAVKNTGAANRAYKELGINLKELAKMDTYQRFVALTDILSRIEDKGSLAFELFGDAGQRILPGITSIRSLTEEARAMGFTFSDRAADNFANFNDNMLKLKNILKFGFAQALGELVVPFNKLIENVTKDPEKIKSFIEAFGKFADDIIRIASIGGKAASVIEKYLPATKMTESDTAKINDLKRQIEKKEERIEDFKAIIEGEQDSGGLLSRFYISDAIKNIEDLEHKIAKLEKKREEIIAKYLGTPGVEGGTGEGHEPTTAISKTELKPRPLPVILEPDMDKLRELEEKQADAINALKVRQLQATGETTKAKLLALEIAYKKDLEEFGWSEKIKTELTKIYEAERAAIIENASKKPRFEKDMERIKAIHDELDGTTARFDAIKAKSEEIQANFAGGLTDGIMEFLNGTKSAEDAFKQFAATFLREMAAMIIQQQILNALKNSNYASGIFGFLAGAASADGNVLRGGFQAFANGGIVNKPTLGIIGEGPTNEAVVPLPDGRTIPVSMLGGGRGSVEQNIHINMQYNADQDAAAAAKQGKLIGAMIKRITREELATQQRHGGILAKANRR